MSRGGKKKKDERYGIIGNTDKNIRRASKVEK